MACFPGTSHSGTCTEGGRTPRFFQRSIRERCWRAVPTSTPRSWQARLVSPGAPPPQVLAGALRLGERVALGVDGEGAGGGECLGLPAQEPRSGRVKGRDP